MGKTPLSQQDYSCDSDILKPHQLRLVGCSFLEGLIYVSQFSCRVCGNRVKNARERIYFEESILHTMCMKRILAGLARDCVAKKLPRDITKKLTAIADHYDIVTE